MAVVLPLHKKDNPTNKNNYRHISLLSSFSKILEKLIKSRLLSFLLDTKFLNSSQFGYLNNSNTDDAIIRMLSQIFEGISSNHKTSALFIDVMKAFDTVDHLVLLSKLYRAGIRGIAQEFFKSYLENRSQITRVGDVDSNELVVLSGVPQGSVLGPILFLMYINSLLMLKLRGQFTAFADDTVLTYVNTSNSRIIEDMQDDLTQLRKWFNMHSLALSEKSVFMTFTLYNDQANISLNSLFCHTDDCNELTCSNACISINRVVQYKYLGLWIDNHLDFKKHFTETQTKIFTGIRKLNLLRNIVPKKILRSLYYPLINCHLEYAIAAWGGSFVSNINILLKMQKYALRVINFKTRFDSTVKLFEKCNILPIRKLYIYKVLKIFYKRSGYLKYIKPKNYYTRSVECFVPFTRKTNCKLFYTYKAPFLFNKLPPEIKSARTFSKFSKELRSWLMKISEVEKWF